jgi:acetyl esterase
LIPATHRRTEDGVPVDPQIQGMLDLLARLDGPKLAGQSPQAAREGFEQMTTGMRVPEMLTPVASTRDITVPGPAGPLHARVYRPEAQADESLPTVLFIHGGGFVLGSVETHDNQARSICRATRSVVVSLDYRLAPETQFPGPVQDSYAALQWVAENVGDLGGDPERIAVAGDSAGGNLAAVTALLARDAGPAVCAQLLIYPVVDFDPDHPYPSRVDNAEGYFLTSEDMEWFSGNYVPAGTDSHDPRLSPLRAPSLAGLPPAVVLTAEFDPLRDEGEAYAAALAEAGVEVHHHRFDGLIHGFFDLGLLSAASAKAVEIGCSDFATLLHQDQASPASALA